nr:hypothetical protein [Tanacetum cinerariifolium]
MEQNHKETSCLSLVPPLSSKYPWFVAQNLEAKDGHTKVHIFYDLHDPVSYYHCQISELLEKRIRACFHGCWVLLSSNHPRDVMWCLWNPITSKIINLPPLNHKGSSGDHDYIRHYCLLAPPEHVNSILLLMRAEKSNIMYCRLEKRKNIRWTESSYAKQVRIVVNDRKKKKLGAVVITLLPILEFLFPEFTGCFNFAMTIKGSEPSKFAYLSSFLLKASAFPDQKAPSKYVKRAAVILMFSSLLGTKTYRKNYCVPQQCPRWKLSLALTHTTVVASPPLVFSESQDDSKRYNLDRLKEDMTLYNTLRNLVSCNVQGSCPLLDGQDYIFYYHPETQKTPKEEKLRQWYELMLKKASNEGIVVGHNNFYDYFFVPKREENIKLIAARLPYFDDATMVKGAVFTTITSSLLSEYSFKRGKRLESDQSHVDCKQEKEADKEDQIVIRSIKGNHDVERLKLSPLPYPGYEYMLESDGVDSKQENDKDVDVDEDESHLLNLPLYVLSMVIEFSVGVEYLKFRSAWKRCHLAALLISWNNEKASKRLQEYSSLSPRLG